MVKQTKCNTIFPRDVMGLYDEHGCILHNGHNGEHIFVNNFYEDKGKISWDYDWDCGCQDCRTDSFSDMCIVYHNVR